MKNSLLFNFKIFNITVAALYLNCILLSFKLFIIFFDNKGKNSSLKMSFNLLIIISKTSNISITNFCCLSFNFLFIRLTIISKGISFLL